MTHTSQRLAIQPPPTHTSNYWEVTAVGIGTIGNIEDTPFLRLCATWMGSNLPDMWDVKGDAWARDVSPWFDRSDGADLRVSVVLKQ